MHHQPEKCYILILMAKIKIEKFTQNSLQLVTHLVKKCDFNDQIINNTLAPIANKMVFVKCR